MSAALTGVEGSVSMRSDASGLGEAGFEAKALEEGRNGDVEMLIPERACESDPDGPGRWGVAEKERNGKGRPVSQELRSACR